jgi:murein DD-endopeptidase MepM/ murein hydrolase activator NlpD
MTFDSTSTNNVIQENFGGDPLLDGLPKDPLSSLPTSSGSSEPEDQFTKSAGFDGESNENFNPYPTATSWDEMETSSSPGTDTDEETTDSDRDPVTQEPFGEETSSFTEEAESDPITNPGIDREADEDTVNETSVTHENKDKNIESNSSEESEEQENDSGLSNEDTIEEGDREITTESEENNDRSDAENESETSDLNPTNGVYSETEADDRSGESSDSTVNEQEDENSSDDAPTEAVNQSENSVESDRETDEMAGETVSESSEEGEGESDEGEETIAENDGDETGDRTEIDDTENNSTENNETDLSTESGADDSVAEHEEASSDAGSDSSNEDTQAELNDPTEANLTENDEEVNTEDSSDNGEEETEAESTDTTENHAEEDVATEETGESESDPVVDPNISESDINFDVGTFTVDESGEVGIDYLFDGGRYQGQVAIVSLSGMEAYEPGSVEFIQEAARRALSESELGHIAIDDRTEGAKFHTSLGERQWNQGDYQGVKTFAMRPGDKFFVMMVPNGAIERVANDPAIGGASRPLFSLATANPDDEYHVGQIADITGDGSAFAWEDLRVDAGTDRDYNDIIFQVRGAKGVAAHMDDVVKPEKDWRTSDMGQALIDYIQPYITPEQPTVNYDDLDEAIAELEDLFGESESETFEEDFETDLEDSNDRESGSEEVNDELETDETTENDFDEGIEEESVTSENSESEENVSNSSSEEGETVVATPTTEIADSQDSDEQDPETEDPDPLLPTRLSDDEPIGAENTDDLDDESSENSNSVEASQGEEVETVDRSEPGLDSAEELSNSNENQPEIERVEDEIYIPISVTETSEAIEQSSDGNTTVDLENQEDKVNTIETPTLSVELPAITPPPTIAPADLSNLESLESIREITVENRGSELRDRLDNLIEVLQQRSRDPDLTDTGSIETAIARLGVISQGLENPTEAIEDRANKAISRLEEWVVKSTPEAIVSGRAIEPNFPLENQPLVGIIDTGFSGDNPDLDYSRITWGEDRVDGDDDPTLATGEGNEHGTHILGILAATQNNGIGIDGINNTAPIWAGRAVGSGKWAESLVEFVDAARESGQPNAVVNLSLDLTQIDAEGNVTTRYEFTPMERAAIEYARQNNVMLVVAAGNDGAVMSALGQSSQEFDNIITVGAAERVNDEIANSKAFERTNYSSYGRGLDIMAPGGTTDNPELSLMGDGLGTMAGTSVATAKVTGAISQVWAANPSLSYRQVIEIVKDTATDLNDANWDSETGAGLLNMAGAVMLAKATTGEEHDVLATVIPDTWSGEGKVIPTERAASTEFQGKYYQWESYTIKSGDTLSAIALNTMGNGSALYYNFIAQKNGIANPNLIYLGQKILIPRQVSAPATPTPTPPSNNGQHILDAVDKVNPLQWYYLPRDITGDGVKETFCNWFAADVLDQLGVPIPRYGGSAGSYTKPHPIYGTNTPNKPFSAAGLLNFMNAGGNGSWEKISAAEAVSSANNGQVVLASSVGHVAVVIPGSSGSNVRIAQAGATNGKNMGVSQGFGSESPVYFRYKGSVKNKVNSDTNTSYSPPATPGKNQQYIIKSGDTLWAIAQRKLGDGNRWREIKKADGTTFTAAEARRLKVGQVVYLPVNYQTGTGKPVTSSPVSQPKTTATSTDFTGKVMSVVSSLNIRSGPGTNYNRVGSYGSNTPLTFDAWSRGTSHWDPIAKQWDNRWFRIKGTNKWVASAYIYGNPKSNSKYINPPNNNGGSPTDFTGKVMSVVSSLNIRSGPGTNYNRVGSYGSNTPLTFDAWSRGTSHWDPIAKQWDNRWFRIKGTNKWVASAYINGNPKSNSKYIDPPGNSNPGNGSWQNPLAGSWYAIYSLNEFGTPRTISGTHKGIDLSTGNNTPPIKAAKGGKVVIAYNGTGWNDGYGKYVKIDHGDGTETRYAHLSNVNVQQGSYISAGTVIGNVGSTGNSSGNHLHFEIRVNGVPKNPRNYIKF